MIEICTIDIDDYFSENKSLHGINLNEHIPVWGNTTRCLLQ